MICLKLFLRDDKVRSWIESEGIKVSSILMILKRNLGYKDQKEVIKKTNLDPAFLRIKLYWRTDKEYAEIICILNGIIKYYSSPLNGYLYYRGKVLLDFVVKYEKLVYVPYSDLEEREKSKSLMFWTIEKTIERWIKEKF